MTDAKTNGTRIDLFMCFWLSYVFLHSKALRPTQRSPEQSQGGGWLAMCAGVVHQPIVCPPSERGGLVGGRDVLLALDRALRPPTRFELSARGHLYPIHG